MFSLHLNLKQHVSDMLCDIICVHRVMAQNEEKKQISKQKLLGACAAPKASDPVLLDHRGQHLGLCQVQKKPESENIQA